MTHLEALQHRRGLAPSLCPGELILVGKFTDTLYQAGTKTERAVRIYRCDGCQHYLSIDADGVVSNDYLPTSSPSPAASGRPGPPESLELDARD